MPRTNPSEPPSVRIELVLGSLAVAIALCIWGAIGWRRAYQAQADAAHLAWTEKARDGELLRVVVKGGEAAAQLAVEGASERIPRPGEWLPAEPPGPADVSFAAIVE